MAYILNVIESHVNALNPQGYSFTYVSAEKDWQNLQADEFDLEGKKGVVIIDRPLRWEPQVLMSGAYKREYILVAIILFKDQLDSTPEQQDVIMELANDTSKQLHLRLNKDKDNIEAITVQQCYELRHLFDTDMSGILMPFRVIHRPEGSVCLT